MGACRFPRWSPNDCCAWNAQARWIHGSAKVKPEGIRMSERVPSKTLKISLLVNRQANPEICDDLDHPANGSTSNAARVLMSLWANVLALTSTLKSMHQHQQSRKSAGVKMAPKVFSNDSFHFASSKTGWIANAFILKRFIKKLMLCPIQKQ